MLYENVRFTQEELEKRWKTSVGQAFREKIVWQLQNGRSEHKVDWENLRDEVEGGIISWWRPYYLSFVTMTTLGVASIEPGNGWAAFAHTVQNVIGYGWLGYLIAVLGAKFTRRSA